MEINIKYPALNAKMKCMYANNLSKDELEELIRQNNLREAINYLKIKFPYLENLNENMHRKEIEQELNNLFILNILKLIKYLNKKEKEIFMEFLSKYELDYIKNIFRNLTTNMNFKEYLKDKENWTLKVFKNLKMINDVSDEREFLKLIKSEDFYKIFEEYQDIIDNAPLEEIEVKLDKFYFCRIYNLSKKINKDLEYLIGTEIDLLNIIWIYRAKKFFNYSIEQIKEILIPIRYKINKNTLEELLNSTDFNDMKMVLENTVYKEVFLEEDKLEYEKDKYLYKINIRLFKTKLFNICTIFCNINLIDIEIKNIINIIEGIRYKLDKTEIQKKIVI